MISRNRAQRGSSYEGDRSLLTGDISLTRSGRGERLSVLLEEFTAAWERGIRQPAEEIFERHPWLITRTEAAIRVIYEEICLRQSEGHEVTIKELERRFPQWRTELEVLLDCDRLLGEKAPEALLPSAGEALGDFLLLVELGRGAKGRCFLAAQPSLSNRQVVVKVTPDDHIEHLSLARLQHTHIMPLYSEHAFPGRKIRALCTPYLGGATLARILGDLGKLAPDRRSGQSILDVLDCAQETRPWPQSFPSPARRFLAQASYDRAICWMGACLADALQYAHDRELVHMDVKPSNILLTADCQPMLLDFHLARAPVPAEKLPADAVGGTPGYMSPEQHARVSSIASGGSLLPAIGARSDVYSLGQVLAQMIDPDRQPGFDAQAMPLSSNSPDTSTGLLDLIRKCLAFEPEDRYPSAAALAEDLRRHMANQPLRGVPNRSVRERWSKWRRRQPYLFFRLKILASAACLAAAVAASLWATVIAPRIQAASHGLREGRAFLEHREYSQAARILTRAAASIEGLPGSHKLSVELAAALQLTDHLEDADRLHRLADRVRFAESAADGSPRPAREVEALCRSIWESRRSILGQPQESLDVEVEQRLRDDLLDIAVIGSNLRVSLETDSIKSRAARHTALGMLEEAESLFGPRHVLYRARQAHATALGLSKMAAVAAEDAARNPPRTAWEHDAVGRVLLTAGNIAQAEAAFQQALALRPQDLWPNFHEGVCAFRLRHYQEALSAFRVCTALAPDRAECFYNRALAYAALGHSAEAAADREHAIELDPSLAEARFSRSGSASGR